MPFQVVTKMTSVSRSNKRTSFLSREVVPRTFNLVLPLERTLARLKKKKTKLQHMRGSEL